MHLADTDSALGGGHRGGSSGSVQAVPIQQGSVFLRGSAPRVRAVLHVVVLEFNLILDLVDQDLREQNPHQL